MKKFLVVSIFILVAHIRLVAQKDSTALWAKKSLSATNITQSITIDGELNEAEWASAQAASDFVINQPNTGAAATHRSDVRVLYDNQALYIGALLYDIHPDSIAHDLSKRDDLGNTDWFALILDAYRDGINGVGFIVSASGVQVDVKYLPAEQGGEDGSWDAVWNSSVQITDKGWVVELKIPYSAIRFPKATEQQWHINFGRFTFRSREKVFWNHIRPDQALFLSQCGLLNGIKNIESPVRLSATPYIATRIQNHHDNNGNPKDVWSRSINGGVDIKYGINDAFTLDATLIPDFGQVRSDAQILNLSPFEVQFQENRPFFTEGIELFNKGGLFYSRRIGGTPLAFFDVYDQLQEGERIIKNPTEAQLYNATKISGRTNKGLGIGLFNAIAGRSEAIIETAEGNKRTFETGPLTNYNVVVLDQNLKNNSYVTLTNTNVWRNGSFYDANVTNLKFSARNKSNTYELNGSGSLSQKLLPDSTDYGHKYSFGFAKTSGQFQYSATYNEESYNYNPNDLGFLLSPNERSFYGNVGYYIFKPFGKFNRFSSDVGIEYTRLHRPDKFNNFAIYCNTFFLTKKNVGFGVWGGVEPIITYDYFEPRSDDFSRYYTFPTNYRVGGFYSSDYSKPIAFDINVEYRDFNDNNRYNIGVGIFPRLRFNAKFFMQPGIYYEYNREDIGYIFQNSSAIGFDEVSSGDIIFGRRNRHSVENYLGASYTFNNKMNFTLNVRHYWSKVDYLGFHLLDKKGELAQTPYTGIDKDDGVSSLHNIAFDAFTVDAVYTWRFAPGSDIVIVWKNNIFAGDTNVQETYLKHTEKLFRNPQTNSLSIKVLYYLDYLRFRKTK
ncbi:MAG: carbohydrate binding family 9 domain-containing protein [Saprospiraceae bacterium]|nr:carbohydrate binding family 9 domain-containing protein [Saprospiraceae bacterium]MBP7679583.1 carbohydrate binding family 9 domain-containing protein [Saprospiraceae bacterium]